MVKRPSLLGYQGICAIDLLERVLGVARRLRIRSHYFKFPGSFTVAGKIWLCRSHPAIRFLSPELGFLIEVVSGSQLVGFQETISARSSENKSPLGGSGTNKMNATKTDKKRRDKILTLGVKFQQASDCRN